MTSLLLETVSLDYHETLMVPSGDLAEKSRIDTIQNYPGQYICIVEGPSRPPVTAFTAPSAAARPCPSPRKSVATPL